MSVKRCRVKVRGKRRCGLRELWPCWMRSSDDVEAPFRVDLESLDRDSRKN